jgi:hypothetical protein
MSARVRVLAAGEAPPHHLEIAQCVDEVSQSAVAGGSHDDAMELRVEL